MNPGWIILGVIVLMILWMVFTYNSLVALRNRVKNAWKQISVQLKRRYDLIPNLVETVKDYMEYEQETLEKVIQARNAATTAQSPKEQAEAEGAVTTALRQLFAVVENYPQLKANESVQRLMEELTSTENKIAFARQLYNDLVMKYNTRIEQFPTNLVAGWFNFQPFEFFEIPEEEKAVPKVDLR